MNTSNKNSKFDVVIVGAGVAGAACAYEIAASGQSVAILFGGTAVVGTESLSPSASKNLEALGVKIGSPFHENMAWWGSPKISRMPCKGARIVRREDLALQMRFKIQERGAVVYPLFSVPAFTKSEIGWLIEFADPHGEKVMLESHFLIDASGRGSVVGRAMKARRHIADKLCCLSVSTSGLPIPGTWTESAADGWWNLCSSQTAGTLAFYSTPTILKTVRKRFQDLVSTTDEIKRISNLTFDRATNFRVCGSSILRPCAGPGWLAVGDAAMTVQPLASAGVAKAFRDSHIVIEALKGNPREYVRRAEVEFQQYAEDLKQQYSIENRWPESYFWKMMRQNNSLHFQRES